MRMPSIFDFAFQAFSQILDRVLVDGRKTTGRWYYAIGTSRYSSESDLNTQKTLLVIYDNGLRFSTWNPLEILF